ncbi:MAG: mechanosensitive ion channel family protein, partial [Tannerellaceae bacterium]|nr:mechanosensitive ion channel family protein [Tannerellaceae bacterium]
MEPLRNKLTELLQAHPKWDRRVANIQVTDTKQNYKELRVLLSSMNSSVSWDLRVDIREKLIDYINT